MQKYLRLHVAKIRIKEKLGFKTMSLASFNHIFPSRLFLGEGEIARKAENLGKGK